MDLLQDRSPIPEVSKQLALSPTGTERSNSNTSRGVSPARSSPSACPIPLPLVNGGQTPEAESTSLPSTVQGSEQDQSDAPPSIPDFSLAATPTAAFCKSGHTAGADRPHRDICGEDTFMNASLLDASTTTMARSVFSHTTSATPWASTPKAFRSPLEPSEQFGGSNQQQQHSALEKPETTSKATPKLQLLQRCPHRRTATALPTTVVPEPERIQFTTTGKVLALPRGGYTLALLRSGVGLPQSTSVLLILSLPLLRHVIPGLPHVTLAGAVVTLVLLWFVNYVRTNVAFWARHLHRDEEECRNSRDAATKPFLSRRVEVRGHHVVPNKSVFAPIVTGDYVQRRAFATVGLTVRAYLRDLVTYALEYKIQAVWRLIAVDLGLGQYSAAPTGESLYRYVINTSVGCFIDAESGHVELYDTCLPYKTSGMKTWHRMVLELDHEAHRAVRLLVQETRVAEGERPTVLVIEDMMEMHAIMTQVGMLKTHVHVHWFANGVAELADSWALAEESSDMVQGLNNGAVFSTEGVYQNKTATMATMTAYNVVTEGLPVHNDLRKIGEHSLLHKMSVKARLALYEVLPNVPRIQIEALVAATLMHSADHYYAGTSLSYRSLSELLQCDFTLARSTVMSPNRYRTRKLLCREHLDDPVCRALYLSAVGVDPEFANDYLVLAVAN